MKVIEIEINEHKSISLLEIKHRGFLWYQDYICEISKDDSEVVKLGEIYTDCNGGYITIDRMSMNNGLHFINVSGYARTGVSYYNVVNNKNTMDFNGRLDREVNMR